MPSTRIVLQAAALAVVALALAAAGALGATRQVNVEPASLVAYGAVIRHAAAGDWKIVAEGSHVVAGFRTITCDARSGALRMTYDRLATVASAWVVPDETMSRRGIIAGPSVGSDHWVILFTRLTEQGPQPLPCDSPLLRGDRANFWVGVLGQPIRERPKPASPVVFRNTPSPRVSPPPKPAPSAAKVARGDVGDERGGEAWTGWSLYNPKALDRVV